MVRGCLHLTCALKMVLLDQSGTSIQCMRYTGKSARLVTRMQKLESKMGAQYQEAGSQHLRLQNVRETYQETQVWVGEGLFWEITYTCSGYDGCITNDPQL